MSVPFPSATILGYPRIGPHRELKRALEAHWAGTIDAADLSMAAGQLRERTARRLMELGLREAAAIPADFSAYDHMLDAVADFGAIPERFDRFVAPDGSLPSDGYFALARGIGGRDGALPLEMTKWFDSNYHYLVPEIGPATPLSHVSNRLATYAIEARAWGTDVRPVIVGPLTFLALAKPAATSPAGFTPLDRLDELVEAYASLLEALARADVAWLQLDEPALVADLTGIDRAELVAAAGRTYARLAALAERPQLFVAAPYGSIGAAAHALAEAGVDAIGMDLVRGHIPPDVRDGALANATVVAGVVDGHNIWRTDLTRALATLQELAGLVGRVAVTTSTSLLHVPHDVDAEPSLPGGLKSWLAFADQKVDEVRTLAAGLADPASIADELAANADMLAARAQAPGVADGPVRPRVSGLTPADARRPDFAERRAAQTDLGLPPLPTTTIGSFPQTPEIRVARAAFRRGEMDENAYLAAMRSEIGHVVELQEDLGLDVLVHGEAERNDMVQYFAELLDGFATTQAGWVQSYGSRCTRPPILWGDVSRPAPMTVSWTVYAQSLTAKPMKGMLTGPVTILAWSFVRDDQPLADTARQVALALRDEIDDLQAAGVRIVQVDEPALRELLPLRAADRPDYLSWSVEAFRVATGGAGAATQIHTHLCYSEFGDVMSAIDQLDADVTSIEAARSKMEIVADIAAAGFGRGIGPGVYDIHSPRIPTKDEIAELLRTAVSTIAPEQLWVNPDCGLKTRRYAEVTPSLEAMVQAAQELRATL